MGGIEPLTFWEDLSLIAYPLGQTAFVGEEICAIISSVLLAILSTHMPGLKHG
jgi:hypothetical protein